MTALPAPERWRLIAPLLERALDLPAEERAPFLDRECGGDSGLRAEIQALLSADSEAGTFLGEPVDLSAIALEAGEEEADSGAAEDAGPDASARRDAGLDAVAGRGVGVRTGAGRLAGMTMGQYRVVREIGRGGMGVVYEAEQQRPRRRVALKVILGGRHVDDTTIRMFQREADSLARLKHPGIAAIYESGVTEDGQHFFAMELARGRTLSAFLADRGPAASRVEVRHRLALFRKIAAAVAYAHQRGVIHRDLKPSNILVLEPAGAAEGTAASGAADGAARGGRARGDGAPDIKVLDFGLARITEAGAEGATAVTALGSIQGTLPYMSPEQVRGRRDEIDVRSDLYALGVILYRMLAGRLPYDLDAVDFPEAVRIICEQPPRPLRAAAAGNAGAAAGATGAARVDGSVGARIDHDLTVVVLKALAKDPARRYQTVAAFDEDLGRYLAGQPILARPPRTLYQLRKLIGRHKVPFAAAAALLVALVGFALVTTVQARRIAAERDRAGREAATAERVSEFLTGLFNVSDPDEAKGNVVTAREILDKGIEKIGKDLASEPEVQARLMLTMGHVYQGLGLYRSAEPLLENSVSLRRRLLGEEHRDTLASMDELAFNYFREGQAAKAEAIYSRLVDLRRRLLGAEHPDTLRAMRGLALAYSRQGRFDEEERIARQILEVRRRTQGEAHADTLLSMADLGLACGDLRRYAEAESLDRAALDGLRRLYGDDDSRTSMALTNLGDVYIHQERYTEAETLYREQLERDRRVLGPDHPTTLNHLNNLGNVFDAEGRYADAEPYFAEALAGTRHALGEDHQETLNAMNNLANVYASLGRRAEAEALYRESLERERRVLGENHPDTTNTLYNLACLDALRGDRRKALDWLDQAVAHGYSHWDVIERDSDLKILRGDPRFDAIVGRARKNSGG